VPRPRRFAPADSVLHIINRGNDRKRLFRDARDYDEFLELTALVKARSPIRLVAYCLMPNHWHMVVWPRTEQATSTFFHRLATLHALRRRHRDGTLGQGHVYQRRFHSLPVTSERQFYLVVRYVEGNALRAGLVSEAQQWRWSSLAERSGGSQVVLLDQSPLPLPSEWTSLVNDALPAAFLEDTRARLRRSRPRPDDV
jgi:putative transposase